MPYVRNAVIVSRTRSGSAKVSSPSASTRRLPVSITQRARRMPLAASSRIVLTPTSASASKTIPVPSRRSDAGRVSR
jgi:hypothetical protein